ncbi:MAG: hypothetical protein ACREP6_14320 [Candidatus Binataceae bacterium]
MAMPVHTGRHEKLIEFCLLLRRQQRTNSAISLPYGLMAAAPELAAQIAYLVVRIFHHRTDLIALRRRQGQLPVHSLHNSLSRHRQQPEAESRRAGGEPNQQSGN